MASIVRVGASNDIFGQQLTEALGQFLPLKGKGDETSSSSNDKVTQLSISNRYFDATVALCPLSLVEVESTTDQQQEKEGKEDGILLVFDDSSKDAFDVLAGLHGTAASSGQDGDLLRLCVGVVTPTSTATMAKDTKEYEDEYSRRVLWCLDHGYEFVEAVDLSPEGIQQGHDAREKEGFARVVEAVQGTVWSSANMHAQAKQQLKQSYQETREQQQEQQEQQQEEDGTAPSHESEYEPPPTTLPELTISDEESKEREEKARTTLLEQDGILHDEQKVNHMDGPSTTTNTTGDDLLHNKKAEKIMSDMESALAEATRIRDLSQAGELSDDDRRQRAGDAAMLLMNLMNQMGDDDDDSDDDEDSDNHGDNE